MAMMDLCTLFRGSLFRDGGYQTHDPEPKSYLFKIF